MFLSAKVAEKALSKGLIDDFDVILEFGSNDYLHPCVTAIHSTETEDLEIEMGNDE